MEIAFYILLVSWVILLACCIVAISRFKKANDSLDTSLDTVIERNEEIQSLMNQLDVAEQDIDFWKDTCDKMQWTINDLNKRIGNMKATEENGSILYVDKGNIEYVNAAIDISANVIKDITEGRLDIDQVEDSLRFNIKRVMMDELLSHAKFYVTYDISSNSYSFVVRIPIVALNGSEREYSKCAGYPLTNILLEKVKEE